MFLIRERVYKSKIETMLDEVDRIIKHLPSDKTSFRSYFHGLRKLESDFWRQLRKNPMTVVMQWVDDVKKELYDCDRVIYEDELRDEIYEKFLTRLAMDNWLLSLERGSANAVRDLFVQSIENVIYNQFSLHDVSKKPPATVVLSPREKRQQEQQQQQSNHKTSQFKTLFEDHKLPPHTEEEQPHENNNSFLPPVDRLSILNRIEQDLGIRQTEETDNHHTNNTKLTTEDRPKDGIIIRLKKPSQSHRSAVKKKKKKKKRKSLDRYSLDTSSDED